MKKKKRRSRSIIRKIHDKTEKNKTIGIYATMTENVCVCVCVSSSHY